MSAHGESVDASLRASRALLGVVARSAVEALRHLSVVELRILVLLTSRGSQSMDQLAERMGEEPVVLEPAIDALRKNLFIESGSGSDPAADGLSITPHGRATVDEVTERRRTELAAILGRMTGAQRRQLDDALGMFADAAGEPPAEELLILGL